MTATWSSAGERYYKNRLNIINNKYGGVFAPRGENKNTVQLRFCSCTVVFIELQLLQRRLHALNGLLFPHHRGQVGAAARGAGLAGEGDAQREQQPAVLLLHALGQRLARLKDRVAGPIGLRLQHGQQGGQGLLRGLGGRFLLLVALHLSVNGQHGVKEVELRRDVLQHLAAGLQVGAEQVTVNAAVHGAVDERVGQAAEHRRWISPVPCIWWNWR